MPHSRHGHFHLILILSVKMVELPQQPANTTVHWLQTLPLPIVTKSSILHVAEFVHPSLKKSPCMKSSPVSCETQSFFLLFRNIATFIESHCLLSCYFLQYDEVFLISLLAGCYHYLVFMDQVSDCSKSKLLVKE